MICENGIKLIFCTYAYIKPILTVNISWKKYFVWKLCNFSVVGHAL